MDTSGGGLIAENEFVMFLHTRLAEQTDQGFAAIVQSLVPAKVGVGRDT